MMILLVAVFYLILLAFMSRFYKNAEKELRRIHEQKIERCEQIIGKKDTLIKKQEKVIALYSKLLAEYEEEIEKKRNSK